METKEVFDKVASRYDIMNDIMSLGAHRYWKELLIDWLSPEKEMHIIDVAGGTGDIARRFEVRSIPTLIVFDEGVPTKRIVGAKSKDALLEDLSEFI